MNTPLPPGSLAGKTAVITGSSRGIGADTARYLAAAGANVVINYRKTAPRAEKLVIEITDAGGSALAVQADLTDPAAIRTLVDTVKNAFGAIDLLILNASGGMESGMAEDYALTLNRDAQVNVVDIVLPLMPRGSRIVFVTSHQAHFIRTTPTMDEYVPVAQSKRAGEDALRAKLPVFDAAGVGFVVVSGDMIEGTITAKLLERANPDAIRARKEQAGKLYNVAEFAAEVAQAAVDPIPTDHTRYVGDTSGFARE